MDNPNNLLPPRERFQTPELVRNFEDPNHVLERLAAPVSPPLLRNPPLPGQQQSRFARHRAIETTRDTRIQIQTGLLFKVPHQEIHEILSVTESQIQYARKNPITPRKKKGGRKPVVNTPQRQQVEQWLQGSPSRRRIPWKKIPRLLPGFEEIGETAMRTCLTSLGYCRRTSIKKGFSTELQHLQERLEFARIAIQWTEEQVFNIAFSDEVWAMGGVHITSFVTVKSNGSDRYSPENL